MQSGFTTVKIFCDGACSGNPGIGGWGAVIVCDDLEQTLSGSVEYTTNNRMELVAAIRSLEQVKEQNGAGVGIEVHTDSKYVKDGITSWIHNWHKNNWMTSSKKPVKNAELWRALHDYDQIMNITWYWVKGHSGHHYNDKADYLAREAINKFKNNQRGA